MNTPVHVRDTHPVPEFGSVAEAAEFFGTGQAAIRSGVADGSIPHVKLGRLIRIPLRLIADRLTAEVSIMTPRGLLLTQGSALMPEDASGISALPAATEGAG